MNSTATHPILLCYDGSANAQRAIATAAALFPGHRAIVLQVWTPIEVTAAAYGAMIPMNYDESELLEAAKTVAREGAELASTAGLDAMPETVRATFEGTWREILTVAERHDVALVVLGARGLSTFKSLLLGSVSHGVAQHARCPVLVVPPPAEVEGETPAAITTATAS